MTEIVEQTEFFKKRYLIEICYFLVDEEWTKSSKSPEEEPVK